MFTLMIIYGPVRLAAKAMAGRLTSLTVKSHDPLPELSQCSKPLNLRHGHVHVRSISASPSVSVTHSTVTCPIE